MGRGTAFHTPRAAPQTRGAQLLSGPVRADASDSVNCMKPMIPFPQGVPFTTAQARRAGLSDRALADAVGQGALIRSRRGWFHVPTPADSRAAAAARQSRIALCEGPAGAVVSHHTAAVLHGLPLVRARTSQVHLTADRPNGGRTTGHARLHSTPRDTLSAVEIDGIPVTGVARTLVDVSRTAGFEAGVCATDFALRKQLVTPQDLAREVDQHSGRTGVAIARDVAGFADPDSESAGESLSRCVMRSLPGIPAPRLQHRYFDGVLVARTDFSWGDGALAGEFDGRVKYTRDAAYGDDPSDVVWREKQREDRIRDLGVVVVRWIWADLHQPEQFRRYLLAGLRRAGIR